MKIETTVLTKTKGVTRRTLTTRNGNKANVVRILTEIGWLSNFESVWEKQNLDLDAVNEDDLIEVTYTTYTDEARNREYKNFISVRKAVCGKPDDTELKALAGRRI